MTPLSLKLWRVARGLNQTELARLLGVSQQLVSAWECGDRQLPDDIEARLEALTNVPDSIGERSEDNENFDI